MGCSASDDNHHEPTHTTTIIHTSSAAAPWPERSTESSTEFSFELTNDTAEPWDLIWIDFDGKQQQYASIAKGESNEQDSHTSHFWIIKSKSGKIESFRLGKHALFLATDCEVNVSDLLFPARSEESSTKFSFELTNDTAESWQLLWIDFDGKQQDYGNLAVGESSEQDSFTRHYWKVKSASGITKSFRLTFGLFSSTDCEVKISEL